MSTKKRKIYFARFIPWFELFTLGPIVFIFSICCWLLLSSKMANPAVYLVFWTVCAGIAISSFWIIVEKFFAQPTYVTKQGVAVWTCFKNHAVFVPTILQLERALDDFAQRMPIVLGRVKGVTPTELAITTQAIEAMYAHLEIRFTSKTIAMIGIGFRIKETYLAQTQNKIIILHFPPFTGVQLYHALFHAVDQLVLRRPSDRIHWNAPWWQALLLLQVSDENKKEFDDAPIAEKKS